MLSVSKLAPGARVAGHADPSATLRVYGHLLADGLAEAARRYDPPRALR